MRVCVFVFVCVCLCVFVCVGVCHAHALVGTHLGLHVEVCTVE